MSQPVAPEVLEQIAERTTRIRDNAKMVSVLVHYGYHVQEYGEDREQQFRCDLHGTGEDNTPSARVYDNGFYCWGCQQNYDVIDLVRIKEGVNFTQACTILEKAYGLPALPWIDYKYEPLPAATNIADEVLTRQVSFEDVQKRTRTLLTPLTHDRMLPRTDLLGFWESFDKVCYLVHRETLSEKNGATALSRLRERVVKALQKENET